MNTRCRRFSLFRRRLARIPGRAKRRSRVALTVFLLVGTPAAAGARRAAEPVVSDTIKTIVSVDGSCSAIARELRFAGTVVEADYDSSSRCLLVRYYQILEAGGLASNSPNDALGRREEVRSWKVLAYDLSARSVRWSKETNASLAGLFRDRALLRSSKKTLLVDASSGAEIARWSGNAILYASDGAAVGLDSDEILRYDIESGGVLWRARKSPLRGELVFARYSNTLFAVGEGLMAMDLGSGVIWEYALPTSRSDVASTVATNIVAMGASLVALGLNGFFVPPYWGTVAKSLHSTPLLDGDQIYFAADTSVVCLHRETGRCLWRKSLGVESWARIRSRAMGWRPSPGLPGSMFIRDAGSELAVLSRGWAQGNGDLWRADPPSIAMVSKETGATRVRVRIEGADEIIDYRRTDQGHFILAPERMVLLDEQLGHVRTYEPVVEHARLLGFLPVKERLMIVSSTGLFALSGDSLAVVDKSPLGTMVKVPEASVGGVL